MTTDDDDDDDDDGDDSLTMTNEVKLGKILWQSLQYCDVTMITLQYYNNSNNDYITILQRNNDYITILQQ